MWVCEVIGTASKICFSQIVNSSFVYSSCDIILAISIGGVEGSSSFIAAVNL